MNKVTIGENVYLIDDETYSKIESLCNVASDDVFDRHPYGTHYYYIDPACEIGNTVETGSKYDDAVYNSANYCTDYMTMLDRANMELLTRLLWRYGASRESLTDFYAESGLRCWAIDWSEKGPYVALHIGRTPGAIYFKSEEEANMALCNVVIPFIANHPDFRW